MNGKRVSIAGGFIAVVLVSIAAALVLYPISPANAESRFSPAEAAGHETSGSILIDGETYVDYEGTVSPDGTGFFEARSDDGYVRELYEEDGVVYARLVTTDTDRVDDHRRTFGSEIVSQEETDGQITTILRADEPEQGVETPIETWNEVVVDNLSTSQSVTS